jgi:fimbrial chaperone protein
VNKLKNCCVALALMAVLGQAQAAFVINGTRFIYPAGQNSIVATVRNQAKLTYGGQVWVASSVANQEQANFVPSPTFFKLSPGQAQVVRILGVQESQLPTDRESLFLLNIQEIPPAPKPGSNAISIAMNTQVKLIYRPEALAQGRRAAEQQLRVSRTASGLKLENPTPYYLAISTLQVNGQRAPVNAATDKALATLAPFSTIEVTDTFAPGAISADLLDDHGASHTVQMGPRP